jgi:hypothetical protein
MFKLYIFKLLNYKIQKAGGHVKEGRDSGAAGLMRQSAGFDTGGKAGMEDDTRIRTG